MDAGVRSPLELDYLRLVERAHGLPHGTGQVRRRRTEVEVVYEEYGLVVELDGRLGHSGLGAFRDRWRDKASTTDGLATLRYGLADAVDESCLVARRVAVNLHHRGWTGDLMHCGRCRLMPIS